MRRRGEEEMRRRGEEEALCVLLYSRIFLCVIVVLSPRVKF